MCGCVCVQLNSFGWLFVWTFSSFISIFTPEKQRMTMKVDTSVIRVCFQIDNSLSFYCSWSSSEINIDYIDVNQVHQPKRVSFFVSKNIPTMEYGAKKRSGFWTRDCWVPASITCAEYLKRIEFKNSQPDSELNSFYFAEKCKQINNKGSHLENNENELKIHLASELIVMSSSTIKNLRKAHAQNVMCVLASGMMRTYYQLDVASNSIQIFSFFWQLSLVYLFFF